MSEVENKDVGAGEAPVDAGIDPEETLAEAAEGAGEDLQLLLEDARAKADEHWDLVLRTRAELENLRRRGERELESAHKYALEKFVEALLPVRDSMELGARAAGEANADVDKLREGTELTLRLLVDAMEKFGVAAVDPQGEPFDPERHQAMSTAPTDEVPPNCVATVYQKGYVLNDRLIRPAMVVVAQPGTEK